ncbi:MAG: uracil phosphoribosyltransferase [Candidatus Saccharibacteria bacterium]|nr:uracil phosphoribosyltransferase [Candidatus Saccharibacteria bacterium]
MQDQKYTLDTVILPYPRVTLGKNTHIYNNDEEVALKIGQMRDTTFENFSLLADDLLKFLEQEARKDSDDTMVIEQPILTTGEILLHRVELLIDAGHKNIAVISIVAAPQGVDLLQMLHPEASLYIASFEEGLNRHGDIMPGLGKNGNRLFGSR